MKWFYTTVARVPGRKAHSAQIAQMCRSFLNAGVDLELLRPRRAISPGYGSKTIAEWHGLDREIPSQALPSFDFLSRLPAGLPQLVYQKAYQLLVSTYNTSLIRYLKRCDRKFLLYSRDLHVVSRLVQTFPSVKKVMELHLLEESQGSTYEKENTVFAKCDGLIVVTSAMKDMLIDRGCDAGKILVESNAVDPIVFPGTATTTEGREKLNLQEQGKIIAYVGNFHTLGLEKGLDTIVRAIPLIIRQDKDATFYFVGGPLNYAKPYISKLESMHIPAQHYHFLDRQPYENMHLWLAAADVLVMPLPSHPRFNRITSPLKVFEYMTSGRPMVISELPALRDVLVNERNALLVPPGDIEAFAKSVVQLLREPKLAAMLAEQAREDIRYRTWDARAKRIKDWVEVLN